MSRGQAEPQVRRTFRSRFVSRPSFGVGVVCGALLVFALQFLINKTTLADRLTLPLSLPDTNGRADVIVVPGAGIVGECVPNVFAIHRVRLAVETWRRGRAPLMLFTGGRSNNAHCPVAEVMRDLAADFGVPRAVIFVETQSRSTHENMEFSEPLLSRLGAKSVLVVTDRLHMRRAAAAFARSGRVIERVSVPIYASHPDNVSMLHWGLREYVALGYYWLRGWTSQPLNGVGRATLALPEDRTYMKLSNPSGPIVVLGASYARGWTASSISGFPVINRGVDGQQSWQLLERFDRDVIAEKARGVIIWGFINDIFRVPRTDVDRAVARTRESVTKMIALARTHGIEPILATEVTIRGRDSWSETLASWAGAIARKQSYQDWVNHHVLATNAWLKQMAAREGLLLIDLQDAVSDSSGRRRRIFAKEDGSHISPAGYEAITNYASPLLEQHLRTQ